MKYIDSLSNFFPESISAFRRGKNPAVSIREILDVTDYLQDSGKKAIGTQWDIASAYYVASRKFLYSLMDRMNFPKSIMVKVRALLENNKASLFINDKEAGGIKLKRGLGQGDRISCLLFNILMILPMRKLRDQDLISYLRNTE